MSQKTVLVTGANGYIGNAVAKAFSRNGWKSYGLIRSTAHARSLGKDEILPLVGSPDDRSFLTQLENVAFDVVVSNTEDRTNPIGHLENVRTTMGEIALAARRHGIRPLLMFTSGCKDYGAMPELDGDPGLAAHTEACTLNPPTLLTARTNFGASLLGARSPAYDSTVLRPTVVYGHSSSLYGKLFQLALQSKDVLTILGNPRSIMHSLHVDDCAEAYVSLANYPDRTAVAGEAFNISNKRYETALQIGEALAASYGLKIEFHASNEEPFWTVHGLTNFSQWVGSDKLRALTNWDEHKPSFIEGIEQYRTAYEAYSQG